MAQTNILFPGGTLGPGTTLYPVSASPNGAMIYVCSLTGDDNPGRITRLGTTAGLAAGTIFQGPYGNPSKPLASVFGTNGALSFCAANRGDTIVVLGGHTETLPNAQVTVPAGVNIIGIGYGAGRPIITTGGTTSSITFGGGAQINNVTLVVAHAIASFVVVTTAGVQFVNARLVGCGASVGATNTINLGAGADDFVFGSSEIDCTAGATTPAAGIKATANINRTRITEAFIHGSFSSATLSETDSTHTFKAMIVRATHLRNLNTTPTTVISIPNATGHLQGVYMLTANTAATVTNIVGTPTATTLGFFSCYGLTAGANHTTNAILAPAAAAALP